MIGIPRVASAAGERARSRSWPSFWGSSRSIRIRSGAALPTASSAAIPVVNLAAAVAGALERLRARVRASARSSSTISTSNGDLLPGGRDRVHPESSACGLAPLSREGRSVGGSQDAALGDDRGHECRRASRRRRGAGRSRPPGAICRPAMRVTSSELRSSIGISRAASACRGRRSRTAPRRRTGVRARAPAPPACRCRSCSRRRRWRAIRSAPTTTASTSPRAISAPPMPVGDEPDRNAVARELPGGEPRALQERARLLRQHVREPPVARGAADRRRARCRSRRWRARRRCSA